MNPLVAPDLHTMAVLALTVLTLILFSQQRIPIESSSLFILAVLAAGFTLFPYEGSGTALHPAHFFIGFGHEALVAVCALMIVGQGLVRTGALEPIGRNLSRVWQSSPRFSLLLTLVVGASLSAFVNNTPIVVLLLPILISISLRTKSSASGILMPMGFATLIGGMTTTIGTSTNLLVVSVAADMGLRRMEMFDFFLPAALAGSIGILYLWLVAPRTLPARKTLMTDTSPRVFTAQLNIPEGSFAEGQTLSNVIRKTGGSMVVTRIQRGPEFSVMLLPDAVLKAGDRLRVNDTPERLKEFEHILGATLYSGEIRVDEDHPLGPDDQQIAEVVVMPGSHLEGQSLKSGHFTDRYQLIALALHRGGKPVETHGTPLDRLALDAGDVLLVQGARDQIAALKRSGRLLILDATSDLAHTEKAPIALAVMAGVILCAALGILPIAVSSVCGVALMILTGCLDWRDVKSALSAPIILTVVTSLALGSALVKTGGTDYLAQLFVMTMSGVTPPIMLSGLILFMAIITNMVSNNAAAVIGTPIAIAIAQELGMPPEPFVLAVLFGANMSYATPMAYKTNLLVMNAGGYTFGDFVRTGVPLTIIMWLAYSVLLPILYGL